MYGADQFGLEHAHYLQEQRVEEDRVLHFEHPVKKAKTIQQWFNLHCKIVESLVEEPMFADPKVGEPCLEVMIASAELWGPWPYEAMNRIQRCFVRHYIDTEMVGETHRWESGPRKDPRRPRWNYKMLVLPRGARCSQFEVLTEAGMPLVLGDCAFATETLWKCARNCGKFLLNAPICFQGQQVGHLQLRIGLWDGMPLDEENTMLQGLGGTLAGAMDNRVMREYGPLSYKDPMMTPTPMMMGGPAFPPPSSVVAGRMAAPPMMSPMASGLLPASSSWPHSHASQFSFDHSRQ